MELHSEKIDALAKALSVAQGAIQSAQKDGTNPHFKSSYATLDSIWSACRKPLADNGLAVIQTPLSDEIGFSLITILCHESGQWIKSVLRVELNNNTAQGVGSALTYMRRYALAAMVGVAPSDDDDGEGASGRAQLNVMRNPQPVNPPRPMDPPQSPPPQPESKSDSRPVVPVRSGSYTAEVLLEVVNLETGKYYTNVFHLQNALKADVPGFRWPRPDDKAGWDALHKAAVEHFTNKKPDDVKDEIPF